MSQRPSATLSPDKVAPYAGVEHGRRVDGRQLHVAVVGPLDGLAGQANHDRAHGRVVGHYMQVLGAEARLAAVRQRRRIVDVAGDGRAVARQIKRPAAWLGHGRFLLEYVSEVSFAYGHR